MSTESAPASPQMYDFEQEDLIDIFFDKPKGGHGHGKPKGDSTFYEHIVDKSSNAFSYVPVAAADALRRLYPNHSLIMTQQFGVLGFPGLSVEPLEKTPLITNLYFIPLSKRLVGIPGILLDQVEFGAFKVRWNSYNFIVYNITYPGGFGTYQQHFILHEGPEEPSRLLLLTIGTYLTETHDEIWVFNQGFWDKDAVMYEEVQKANWDDVILKEEFKEGLQKDVYGFFSSEKVYKDLGIAWKRGLIMYGPPGNGKTISIKAIMKECGALGFQPLYVKSFQSWMGEEASMAAVFNKARQLAPCVVVLEDLDSLINDGNRSFFLNQVDGIQGNDGLLLIGTTNHFDRLDPGLSTRPSRFDRKYKFDDPDLEERVLYVEYWQKKLVGNETVDFPDSLVKEIAEITDQFSFAYLKEAFVSSLVTLATWEGDKPTFSSIIKAEIKSLRKQLDKSVGYDYIQKNEAKPMSTATPARPPRPSSEKERDIRSILDALSDGSQPASSSQRRHFTDSHRDRNPWTRRPSAEEVRKNRDIRVLLDALADHLESADISSFRHYESSTPREHDQRSDYGDRRRDAEDYRGLFDRMSERDRDMRLFDLQQHTHQMPPRRSMPFYGSTQEPDWTSFRSHPGTSAPSFNPISRPDLA